MPYMKYDSHLAQQGQGRGILPLSGPSKGNWGRPRAPRFPGGQGHIPRSTLEPVSCIRLQRPVLPAPPSQPSTQSWLHTGHLHPECGAAGRACSLGAQGPWAGGARKQLPSPKQRKHPEACTAWNSSLSSAHSCSPLPACCTLTASSWVVMWSPSKMGRGFPVYQRTRVTDETCQNDKKKKSIQCMSQTWDPLPLVNSKSSQIKPPHPNLPQLRPGVPPLELYFTDLRSGKPGRRDISVP